MAVEIAHSFVLEALMDSRIAADVRVNLMFGTHAIYVGDRIVLALRHREKSLMDNGVWVVLNPETRESVKSEFPALRPIEMFRSNSEGGPTWLCLGEDVEDFEGLALSIVECLIKGDERFGKVPLSAVKAGRRKPVAKKKTPRKKTTKR